MNISLRKVRTRYELYSCRELCTDSGVPIPTSRQTQTERSHARTLQLRAQNASPHQTQPKPTSRGRTIYRLERPNEIKH